MCGTYAYILLSAKFAQYGSHWYVLLLKRLQWTDLYYKV